MAANAILPMGKDCSKQSYCISDLPGGHSGSGAGMTKFNLDSNVQLTTNNPPLNLLAEQRKYILDANPGSNSGADHRA
jgi:hypothetical protein